MTEPSHAVFLSYASQDAEAAQRICEALRVADIEVFFDQSELRGGEVWDQRIRREIRDCALFIPVISANTTSRREGYFRLEWDLADQRSHRMARDQEFIVPVRVDATRDAGTDVPESFHRVQWTRLPGGETPPEFAARIKRLLSPEPPATARFPTGPPSRSSPISLTTGQPSPLRRVLLVAVAVLVFAVLAYLLINRPWNLKPAAPPAASNTTSSAGTPPATFAPPPHSIAVLPFVNMSGDKEQEYFSEGLTEELLNSLSRINELQVAARTSSFSFQGEHPDIATVARKLNVGAVLEGSVRRSAHTVRVTTQLVNGVTGFHLWSQTYDRDLRDVLKLQTEIATAVASALKVTLLGGEVAKLEAGGTRNPAAFDAYLRATKIFFSSNDWKKREPALAGYTEAIRLDPNYALAYAARSLGFLALGTDLDNPRPVERVSYVNAQADARRAVALAPDLAEGHLALAFLYENTLEFTRATEEYERALTLAPGNARVLRVCGLFAVAMGRKDLGLTSIRRAIVLDPLNSYNHHYLGQALRYLRRYEESTAAYKDANALVPDESSFMADLGVGYYLFGDLQTARSYCEANSENEEAQFCLAVTYDKLGRHADAEAMLAKIRARIGDSGAVDYSDIYAQWGNTPKALEWLETAMRLHDPELEWLRLDPFADPIRKEPRFQAIERALKFPD